MHHLMHVNGKFGLGISSSRHICVYHGAYRRNVCASQSVRMVLCLTFTINDHTYTNTYWVQLLLLPCGMGDPPNSLKTSKPSTFP